MDVKIIIDSKKGFDHQFRNDMTLSEFDHYKMKFAIKHGVPKLSKPNWWYEETPFGMFLLHKLCLNPTIGYKISIETKEEWREFYPLFKHYFPSLNEYNGIKNNVAFWNGKTDRVIEDSFYIKWIILNKYGLLNYGELKKMPFKEAMMLYYYAMLDNLFQRAEQFSKVAYDQMRKDMNEDTEELYK